MRTAGPDVLHTMLVRCDRGLGARIWPGMAAGQHRFVSGLLEAREAVPAA